MGRTNGFLGARGAVRVSHDVRLYKRKWPHFFLHGHKLPRRATVAVLLSEVSALVTRKPEDASVSAESQLSLKYFS